MKTLHRFLRTTLAGGLLFLLPIVVIAVIVGKAVALAGVVVSPLAETLPMQSPIGLRTPMLMAVCLLVLCCFAAGVFARTAIAQRTTNWVESEALSNLPGYNFVKAVSQSLLTPEKQPEFTITYARLGDRWQIAFLIERLDSGHVAVFVPSIPNPQSGALYFVTEDSVKPANLSFNAVMKCLASYGRGSRAIIGDALAADESRANSA